MTEAQWQNPSRSELQELLRRTERITVLGVSDKAERPSHGVAAYLMSSTDYEVSLVNPRVESLFGLPVFPSLADLPEPPELVSVFRRQDDLPGVADEAIAAGAKVLWFQLGLWHEDAARKAEAAGLTVVMDRCVEVEHAKLR